MYNIQYLPRKNSRTYKTRLQLPSIGDVLYYLKTNAITATEKPYFFTHIKLSNGEIITQTHDGMTLSPIALADALGLK
jgi:hypothetical protein